MPADSTTQQMHQLQVIICCNTSMKTTVPGLGAT